MDLETWLLRPADQRRAACEAVGINLSREVIVMCAAGISASVGYGALKELSAGKLSLYDGSWAEYSKKDA